MTNYRGPRYFWGNVIAGAIIALVALLLKWLGVIK